MDSEKLRDLVFLNMTIDKLDKLELNEETKKKFDYYVEKIKYLKAKIELLGENSEQNLTANKMLKKLGFNHPEMRHWISPLVFKNGIEAEKSKLSLKNRIKDITKAFEVAANNPTIDIQTIQQYRELLDHLKVELIQNKNNMEDSEYIKYYELLDNALSSSSIILNSYEEEQKVWGH